MPFSSFICRNFISHHFGLHQPTKNFTFPGHPRLGRTFSSFAHNSSTSRPAGWVSSHSSNGSFSEVLEPLNDVHPPAVYSSLIESLKDSFVIPPDQSVWHISKLQDILSWLHNTAGLPWWASIVAITCAFRTLVLPLNISLVRNSSRLMQIKDKIESLELNHSKATTPEEKTQISGQILNTFRQGRCNPFKNIISPILMTPMFLSVFMCVERTIMFVPSCQEGGTLWFQNLSAADPTLLLPILSAITWVATVKVAADRIRTPRARAFENFVTYLSLIMLPVTFSVPQGVFIYWITSNVYSLLQFMVLRVGAVRKFFGIPQRHVQIPSN